MVTFSTFIGLPVSVPLGVASLTGAIASGIISVLTNVSVSSNWVHPPGQPRGTFF